MRRRCATREAVLSAARELFTSLGYASTTVTAIAERAGVAVDTVYASVGRKPDLMRGAGGDLDLRASPKRCPALQRDYVAQVRAAGDAREKLAIYAASIVRACSSGSRRSSWPCARPAPTDASCRSLWTEISERRAANMRLVRGGSAKQRSGTRDLSDDEVADIVWSLNSSEYFVLLVHERGWTPEQFERWLAQRLGAAAARRESLPTVRDSDAWPGPGSWPAGCSG